MSNKAVSTGKDERLYGMDGWEHLYFDEQSAIEAALDATYPAPELVGRVIEIVEYTTRGARQDLPQADSVAEYISERTCEWGEVDEGFCEQVDKAVQDVEVQLKINHILDLIASKITYRMADKIVATHKIRVTAIDEFNIVKWEVVE